MSKLLEQGSKEGEKIPPDLQKIIDEQKKSHEELRAFIQKEVRPLIKDMKKKTQEDLNQADQLLKQSLKKAR